MSDLYTTAFYELIRPGVRSSAAAIVPLMAYWYQTHRRDHDTRIDIRAVRGSRTLPNVVDVGCGEGWWALEWANQGEANEVTGFDGPWPGAGSALTEANRAGVTFAPFDISDGRPFYTSPTNRPWDIALCLEVAEHLADPDPLLATLRNLAPVVFFSGAVPGQPGAGHVSCRWQHEWAASFTDNYWRTADPIRPQVWDRDDVDWWYAQNLFVAWDPTGPITAADDHVRSMIHPRFWEVR